MRFGNDLDFQFYRALRMVLHTLSSAPSGAPQGAAYYDTTLGGAYVYNGTTYRPTDAALLTDASINNSALKTNPLLRANHTGSQLSSTISDLAATVKAYSVSSFAAATTNIAMGGFTLTGLPAPTAAGQAAEYSWVLSQVQSAAAGIASKPPVAFVATSNLTLSGTQTVDGYAAQVGDRALVTSQTTQSQNGVYNVQSGAWTRSVADGPAPGELEPGALWLVVNGTQYAGSQWRCGNKTPITVDTTAVSIVQFSAAVPYSAGNGLTLNGTTFTVTATPSGGLTVSAAGVAVDPTVVGRKFTGTITGDGTTTSFTTTHPLNNPAPLVGYRDSSGNAIIEDNQATNASSVTTTFATAPASGTVITITIIG